MKLAFATNAFTSGRYTLEDALKIIAREGYTGAEILADQPLLWVPDLFSSQEGKARIVSIKTVLKDTGLSVSAINGFTAAGYYGGRKAPPGQDFGPSFCDPDPSIREWRVNYTKQIIDFAFEVQARDISISSGYPPRYDTNDRRGDPIFTDSFFENCWFAMKESIKEITEYARLKGVRINIEYEPFLFVGCERDAMRLIRDVSMPNFGVNFDIGHAWAAQENVADQIRHFGRKIHAVQVEDMGSYFGRRLHYHLVPGEGEMPLKEIFRTFQEVGYDGWFTVELYNHFHHPISVARRSYRTMARLLQEAGYG